MARKQDTKAKSDKPAARTRGRKEADETRTAKAKGGRKGGRKRDEEVGVLDKVAAPVAATSARAKKALRTARTEALNLIPDAPKVPTPSLPDFDVGQFARTIGSQIVSALNTDVGRILVAELLIYVARSLTKAASETEAAQDAKTALLNAGAKIGAVAADAGARMVETGSAAATTGAQLVDSGVSAGVEAASDAAGSAKDLMREVASVAVGAVGGVVADAAQKLVKGKGQGAAGRSEPSRQPATVGPVTGPAATTPERATAAAGSEVGGDMASV